MMYHTITARRRMARTDHHFTGEFQMPRVANDAKSFANRMIEKVIALRSENEKYSSVRADLGKLDSNSSSFMMLSDYLRKIEADRDSLVTTILGMHEKMVTEDFAGFVEFATNLAVEVSSDADANHVALLNENVR